MKTKAYIKVAVIVTFVLLCIVIPMIMLFQMNSSKSTPSRSTARRNGNRSRRVTPPPIVDSSPIYTEPLFPAPNNRQVFPDIPAIPSYIQPVNIYQPYYQDIYLNAPIRNIPEVAEEEEEVKEDESSSDDEEAKVTKVAEEEDDEDMPNRRFIETPEVISASYSNEKRTDCAKTFSLLFKGISKFRMIMQRRSNDLSFIVSSAEVAAEENRSVLQDIVNFGGILILELTREEWQNVSNMKWTVKLFDDDEDEEYKFEYVIAPDNSTKKQEDEFKRNSRYPELVKITRGLAKDCLMDDLFGAVAVDLNLAHDIDELMMNIEGQLELDGDLDGTLKKFNNRWDPKNLPVNGVKIANFRASMIGLRPSVAYNAAAMRLNINRKSALTDTIEFFKNDPRFKQGLKTNTIRISFYGEPGSDAGGLKKEWYSLIANELFSSKFGLFHSSPEDKSVSLVNPMSYKKEDHLELFEFAGLFLAKALIDEIQINFKFTDVFYKHILGIRPDFKDLKMVDYLLFNTLIGFIRYSEDTISYLEQYFNISVIMAKGKQKNIDLKPNGSEILVTAENKMEFITLYSNFKMIFEIKAQMEALMKGFNYLIAPELIVDKLGTQEFEALIAGNQIIDIQDWKENTIYTGYNTYSPTVRWFWEFVDKCSEEERKRLLKFVTSSSSVPIEGFKGLKNGNGEDYKFKIVKAINANDFPRAHSCFNQLDIPEYPTQAIFNDRMLWTIADGNMAYGSA